MLGHTAGEFGCGSRKAVIIVVKVRRRYRYFFRAVGMSVAIRPRQQTGGQVLEHLN
jgi:hypothetical protein